MQGSTSPRRNISVGRVNFIGLFRITAKPKTGPFRTSEGEKALIREAILITS